MSAPTASIRTAPAAEPWYSKVPPAKPFSVSASFPKMIWLAAPMRSDPLPVLAVGRTRSVPPETVTLPPKFAVAPKVTAFVPMAVPMLWLMVIVVPLIPMTTEPAVTFVPVTAAPRPMPVLLVTTIVFVFAAPPEASAAAAWPAVYVAAAGSYSHVPVPTFAMLVTFVPEVPVITPAISFAAVLLPPRKSVFDPAWPEPTALPLKTSAPLA